MKNITITVEEDVARWAKVYAAKHDTSVSRMLGAALKEQMRREETYARAQDAFLKRPARPLKPAGRKYPTRGELYER